MGIFVSLYLYIATATATPVTFTAAVTAAVTAAAGCFLLSPICCLLCSTYYLLPTTYYICYRLEKMLSSAEVDLSISARGFNMLALLFSTMYPLATISSTM
jgi:hypothetical protein